METLTKQEFRKKLQRKVIVGRILTFIILVGLWPGATFILWMISRKESWLVSCWGFLC